MRPWIVTRPRNTLYDRWADRLGFMPTPDDRGIVVEISE
jgi:hypothetical protein